MFTVKKGRHIKFTYLEVPASESCTIVFGSKEFQTLMYMNSYVFVRSGDYGVLFIKDDSSVNFQEISSYQDMWGRIDTIMCVDKVLLTDDRMPAKNLSTRAGEYFGI